MKLPAALLLLSPAALLLSGCLATTAPAKKDPAAKLDVPEGEVLLGSGAPPPAAGAPEVLIGAAPVAAATDSAPAVIPAGPEELLPTVTPEGVIPTAVARPPGGYPIIRKGASGAYVLLKAPGGVPAGTTMLVLRGGKPVGTIRVSTPRQPGWLSADIVEGDIQAGDFARP
jgi:hypothetical protein